MEFFKIFSNELLKSIKNIDLILSRYNLLKYFNSFKRTPFFNILKERSREVDLSNSDIEKKISTQNTAPIQPHCLPLDFFMLIPKIHQLLQIHNLNSSIHFLNKNNFIEMRIHYPHAFNFFDNNLLLFQKELGNKLSDKKYKIIRSKFEKPKYILQFERQDF